MRFKKDLRAVVKGRGYLFSILIQIALGTNPISVAAPAEDGDSFVLDMATTVVALGKVSHLYSH